LTVVVVVIGAVFSYASRGIVWQPDVLAFFSAQSEDVRSMREAAGKPGLATQIRIDVHAAGSPATDQSIRDAAQDLARGLAARGERVWIGAGPAELAAAYASLLHQGPALLTPAEQEAVLRRATPEYLRGRFAEVRSHLADPDGELLLRRLAADPLNLSEFITKKLTALSPTGAQNADAMTMDDGLLATRESARGGEKAGGLHVMLVLAPRTAPSDQHAAEATLAGVQAEITRMQSAHPGTACWVVGAHRGYVENAQRVKADVALVSALGALAVAAAIFLYFYRGNRRTGLHGLAAGAGPVFLCMIPQGIGIGMALGLAGMIHAELPLILLGFAGLLCGSTTDYGIQIIAECRRLAQGVPWDPSIPARAARRLLGPISMSVITSATAFAALGLSTSPGLRAMGLFVSLTSVCIWVVTFFVLPAYITPSIGAAAPVVGRRRAAPLARGLALAAFTGLTLWLLWQTLHVQFNNDPRSLDGSSAAMREEAAAFYRVWGDLRNRAVVLVRGRDAAEALDRAAQVHAYLADQQRDGLLAAVTSPAGSESILPPQAEAAERLAAWSAAWTPERRAALSTALADAARETGMKAAAFTAYASRVATPHLDPAADRIARSPAALFPGFVQHDPAGIILAALVQMRNDVSLRKATAWGGELRLRFADWGDNAPSLLSGNLLIFDATERARAEGERFAPWCFLAILVPMWIFFRRLRSAWLAMTCLLVGLVWVLGSAQLLASAQGAVGGLNLLSLVPVLFTLGVVIDYGIYASTAPPADDGTRTSATFLCALSTIVGSAALIAATHPVLRWLGITLVAGITGGYLTSILIVGPLSRRRQRQVESPSHARGALRFLLVSGRWAVRVALLLLTVLLAVPPLVEWILARQKPAGADDAPHRPANASTLNRPAPRTYAVGDSWMRWRADPANPASGLWEFLLAGDPQGRGIATAKLAGPIDLRIEHEMLDQLDTLLPQAWSRWLVLRGVGTNLVTLPDYISPEIQQEIYAAASNHRDTLAYLAPTYPRILSYHALHDISQMLIDNPLIVPNTFACTGVVSSPAYTGTPEAPGHLLLGRIFDFEGGESFGRQKSVTYVIPPEGERGEGIPFAHVAWPGLSGAVTGMNREKIAVFINAAATSDFRRIGTPTILLAREILQYAHSIDDAQRLIERTQTFVSDILVVADGKTGQARVFEKSPARLGTYDVQNSLVVTNHLVTPVFANDPVNRSRKDEGTTLQRYARARQLLDRLQGHVTPDALAALLRDKRGMDDKPLGWGNRNSIDALIACHAVVMDVTAGHLWVATWPNAEGSFLGVDLMAMLDSGQGAGGKGKPEFNADLPAIGQGQNSMMKAGPDGTDPWTHWEASRRAVDRATAALKRGDPAAALVAADEVVRENPDFYLGHDLRGRALLRQQDFAGAKASFQRALALDPPYLKRRNELEGLIRRCDIHD
jgi:predicted exporter